MKSYFLMIIILFFITIKLIIFSENDFKFDEYSTTISRKLYIHSITHYDYTFDEEYEFEKNYLSGSGYRVAVGSVTPKEFFKTEEFLLNYQIDENYWIKAYFKNEEGYHLHEMEEERYFELQRHIKNNYYISTQWTLAHRKDKIDGGIGFIKTNSDRSNYLKIGIIWEDFVYTDKNVENGEQINDPIGLTINSRYENNNIYIISKSKLSYGYDRVYKNQDLISESKRNNYFSLSVNSMKTNVIGYKLNITDFYKKRRYTDNEDNYIFSSYSILNGLIFQKKLNENDKFFTEINHLYREDISKEYLNYGLYRYEWLPVIGWKGKRNRKEYDFSLKSSRCDADVTYQHTDNYNSFLNLAEFGMTHHFTNNGFIHASVSYFFGLNLFGGGGLKMGFFF